MKKRIDEILLTAVGTAVVALLINLGYNTMAHEVIASEASIATHETTESTEMVATDEQCFPSDYAHVKYPDDFDFYCIGSTMEIWTNEGEYVTSEIRGSYVMAEDGSYVPADYWGGNE
jgi:hypothetical protein